jgi:hypothetical protein
MDEVQYLRRRAHDYRLQAMTAGDGSWLHRALLDLAEQYEFLAEQSRLGTSDAQLREAIRLRHHPTPPPMPE